MSSTTTYPNEPGAGFVLTYLGEIVDAGDSIREMSESRESIWRLIAADESAYWDSGDFEDKDDFIEQFVIRAVEDHEEVY